MAMDSQTRRRWLASCAGATAGLASLAGCLDDVVPSELDADEASLDSETGTDDSGYGNWPMIRYNAANRLSVPHSGVEEEPEILWEAELEGGVEPPVVYDGLAFVSHGNGLYTAVDLNDGDIVWEHETSGRAAPAVSESALFIAGDGVEALDRETGDVQWTSGHEDPVETLRIYDDTVYAGIGTAVVAFDTDGEELFEFETAATVQSLAIDDERVYVRSVIDREEDLFEISAIEKQTQESIWDHQVIDGTSWADARYSRTFPIYDGSIYTIDYDDIVSIDKDTGEYTVFKELERPSWTRPTITSDRIHVRETGLDAYDIESGEKPTDWDPEENTREPVVATDELLYSIRGTGLTSPQKLMAMNSETGKIIWEQQVPELAEAHIPIILNGKVLVAINDPGLLAIS